VELVDSNVHGGIKAAIAQVLTGATWQRSSVHYPRDALVVMPISLRRDGPVTTPTGEGSRRVHVTPSKTTNDDHRSVFPSERRALWIVLPVPCLVVRVLASYQGTQSFIVKPRPPTRKISPGDEVVGRTRTRRMAGQPVLLARTDHQDPWHDYLPRRSLPSLEREHANHRGVQLDSGEPRLVDGRECPDHGHLARTGGNQVGTEADSRSVDRH
jgi:hypothetical protein